MKTALNIIGVILAFVGFVWFLQGINVLPGSFMTGQVKWAVCGAIVLVIGAAQRDGRRARSYRHDPKQDVP